MPSAERLATDRVRQPAPTEAARRCSSGSDAGGPHAQETPDAREREALRQLHRDQSVPDEEADDNEESR
jgi:hypothetical protein